MSSKESSIKEIEGGTIERWKRFLQRVERPKEREEFLPVEELEPWSIGVDQQLSHDEVKAQTVVSVETRSQLLSSSERIPVIAPLGAKTFPEARILRERPVVQSDQLEVRSALGPGTLIEGKFTFDAPVKIEGTLRGEVRSDSLLIIGEDGVVEGFLCVGSLVVNGRARGQIVCNELLRIGPSGEVNAEIEAGSLAIDVGGSFEGTVKRKKQVAGQMVS